MGNSIGKKGTKDGSNRHIQVYGEDQLPTICVCSVNDILKSQVICYLLEREQYILKEASGEKESTGQVPSNYTKTKSLQNNSQSHGSEKNEKIMNKNNNFIPEDVTNTPALKLYDTNKGVGSSKRLNDTQFLLSAFYKAKNINYQHIPSDDGHKDRESKIQFQAIDNPMQVEADKVLTNSYLQKISQDSLKSNYQLYINHICEFHLVNVDFNRTHRQFENFNLILSQLKDCDGIIFLMDGKDSIHFAYDFHILTRHIIPNFLNTPICVNIITKSITKNIEYDHPSPATTKGYSTTPSTINESEYSPISQSPGNINQRLMFGSNKELMVDTASCRQTHPNHVLTSSPYEARSYQQQPPVSISVDPSTPDNLNKKSINLDGPTNELYLNHPFLTLFTSSASSFHHYGDKDFEEKWEGTEWILSLIQKRNYKRRVQSFVGRSETPKTPRQQGQHHNQY